MTPSIRLASSRMRDLGSVDGNRSQLQQAAAAQIGLPPLNHTNVKGAILPAAIGHKADHQNTSGPEAPRNLKPNASTRLAQQLP